MKSPKENIKTQNFKKTKQRKRLKSERKDKKQKDIPIFFVANIITYDYKG